VEVLATMPGLTKLTLRAAVCILLLVRFNSKNFNKRFAVNFGLLVVLYYGREKLSSSKTAPQPGTRLKQITLNPLIGAGLHNNKSTWQIEHPADELEPSIALPSTPSCFN
jgi:hypothetical protein